MTRIAYHPPKSASHGHGPKVRGLRRAWAATQTFLSQHTHARLNTPLSLSVWGSTRWTDPAVAESLRNQAAMRWGPATRVSGEFHDWDLPGTALEEALELVLADKPPDKALISPLRLYVSYAISWKHLPNPVPDAPTDHFKGGSFLGLSLRAGKCLLQPTFVFEASDEDPLFIAQLKRLEQDMPFAPKDTNYHRVENRKDGKGQKLVKLRAGWQTIG